LGQGLRNRFAEAISRDDDEQAKTYVSTAYAFLAIIIFSFIVVFSVANVYIPWHSVLNVPEGLTINLQKLALITFGFYSLRFLFKLITRIVMADQRPALRDAISTASKILILIILYILFLSVPGNLINLALVYSGLPVVVLILTTLYLFQSRYKRYAPSLRYVKLKYAKDLLGLGWKFFIIQVALVVLMMSDNIIITQIFGPAKVTPYQIANKYFRLILMLFTIIVIPLWSATSEALVNKDYTWIRSSVSKLMKIALFFTSISFIMLFFSKQIYSLWVGDSIHINYLLSFLWMSFMIVQMFHSIFIFVINASGYIKGEMYVCIFGMIINIPLSIFLAKNMHMGIEGIILATLICHSLHLLYSPFLYRELVSDNIVYPLINKYFKR
jgi:O-antigen/teichoic acid export membrane protein